MRPPYVILFITMLFLSTTLCLSASNWLYLWMGLDINLLSFMALLTSDKKNERVEATFKYFLPQAIGSVLFLLSGVTSHLNATLAQLTTPTLLISLFIKLGAAPLHFWLTAMSNSLSWSSLLILTTWQKIAPLSVLAKCLKYSTLELPLLVATLSTLIGGMGGLGQTQLRLIMIYSSIGHLGWMVALSCINFNAVLLYFLIYSMMTMPLLHLLNLLNPSSVMHDSLLQNTKMTSIICLLLLSLGGIPPLSGFVLKWLSLQILLNTLSLFWLAPMILGSLLNLGYYLIITFAMMTQTLTLNSSNSPHTPPTVITLALLSLFMMNFFMLLM